MLIQFSVSNYTSIKELVTLSMVAAKRAELRNSNVFTEDKFDLLKSAVLYGANASGKSNFIRAILFAKMFIQNSANTQIKDPIMVRSFRLNPAAEKEPSSFEFIFINNGIRYRYGFAADRAEVKSEWLFYAPKGRETRLFFREKQSIELNADFKEGKGLEDKTRNNALFLSVAAQFNGPIAISILNWFMKCNVISGLEDQSYMQYTVSQFEKESYKKKILDFLKIADLGIEDLNITKRQFNANDLEAMPKELASIIKGQVKDVLAGNVTEIKTLHKKYDEKNVLMGLEMFGFEFEESEGTKKIFALSGPIIDTLLNGKVLFVDELDSRLHPKIIQYIIELFNSKEHNPNNAQLIFVSHNTNILNRRNFRRDQVWFVEKDEYGSSKLFSLIEYKVRNTASFDKDYLEGKYGAVPVLEDIDLLNGDG
jgi:hypothetical protein